MLEINRTLVIVRGGGDIATGSIQKLYRAGFKVLVLEIEKPSAIRREVAFCEAIYEKEMTIEGVTAKLCNSIEDIEQVWREKKIPVLVDSTGESIYKLKPQVVIDGILAKKITEQIERWLQLQ